MNILLIIVDALRPDHLSVNGYGRNTSPNIDNVSKEGVTFLNAYCTLPRSDPSITSIFTGMYPHSHDVRMVFGNKINPSIPTLPEILRSHGYKTIFMGGSGLNSEGLERGFEDFNLIRWKMINKLKRSLYKIFNPNNFLSVTQQYTDIAIKWIKKNSNKKFFLCLHYENLHWPYLVPKPFDNMFDPDYKGKHDFNTLANGKFLRGDIIFGNVKLPREEVDHAIAHYDGGIRYIDAHIGRLFNFINQVGLDENTLIVLTSDHGENFGEHNFYFQHGASLYEPSLKVPLIFRHPKLVSNNEILNARIQNIDIMPTVLDLLDIPLIDKIDGVSLLSLINGKTEKVRDYIFAESIEEHFAGNKRVFMKGVKGKWRTMIIGDWKIIFIPHPKEDIFELYNLKNDPHEENNLIEKEKEIALDMKKRILNFLNKQANEGDADLSSLTEKSKKLLRELGYLE
ncbi:MAG: sulfatase [Candidatus Thorarchaeota archaeon]